jgi:hypothetical protein
MAVLPWGAKPGSSGAGVSASSPNTWSAAQTFNSGELLDKGEIVFDVKAYGATGTGSTDDTSAVQSAINACSAAGGGTVYFPTGSYKLTPLSATVPALTVPSKVTLAGAGREATTLLKNGNGILIDFSGPGPISVTTNWNVYQGIRDMYINGQGASGLIYRIYYVQFFLEENLYIDGNNDVCVDMAQVFDSRFLNGYYADGGSASSSTISGGQAVTTLVRNSAAGKTTLSSGISGTITSLPVAALTAAIPAGIVQVWNAGGQVQNFTTTGAAVSATSIPVSSVAVAFTFVSGNTVNGFGWSDNNTNACVWENCHWEDGLSGALWLTQGPNNSSAANNLFFFNAKIEEDVIGYNAPLVQVDNSVNGVFFSGLYLYAGGFNSGYSTKVTGIKFYPTWGTISNSFMSMGTTVVLTEVMDINTTYGSVMSAINIVVDSNPTTGVINFSGTSITNLFGVSIIGSGSPTFYSGSGPFNFLFDINGTGQMVSDLYNYGVTHTIGGLDLGGAAITNTGTLTMPTSTDTMVGRATTDTLTNKSITKRVNTLTVSSNTYTPNCGTTDIALISSPTANFTVANPTGTPVDGQDLKLRIKSSGTTYTPSWGTNYTSADVTLPTSLIASKTVVAAFEYDAAAAKWILMALLGTNGY